MLRKFGIIAIAATATLMLASCTSTAEPVEKEKGEKSTMTLQGTWEETTTNGSGYLVFDKSADKVVDGKTVKVGMTGNDGCNNIFGDVEVTGNQQTGEIKFEQVASTLMACIDGSATMDKMVTATYDDGVLTGLDKDGEVVSVLEKTDNDNPGDAPTKEAPLANTNSDNNEKEVPLAPDTPVSNENAAPEVPEEPVIEIVTEESSEKPSSNMSAIPTEEDKTFGTGATTI